MYLFTPMSFTGASVHELIHSFEYHLRDLCYELVPVTAPQPIDCSLRKLVFGGNGAGEEHYM